jgi:two-component system sensor histidine kinase/response regulator
MQISQQALVGVVILDANGTIVLQNREATRLLQLEPASEQSPVTLAFHPQCTWFDEQGNRLPASALPIYQAIAQQQPIHNTIVQLQYPNNPDRCWLSITADPYFSPQGNLEYIICTFSDITERKYAETTLQQTKNTAPLASSATGKFLGNMSHELRTPLNAILGFTQILLSDSCLTEEQRSSIDIINRSGQHLLQLINDVLDIFRLEQGKISLRNTVVELRNFLDSLDSLLHVRAVAKGLRLHIDLDPTVPPILCLDESKLRQVLLNLIGTTIKSTSQGNVTLRISRGGCDLENKAIADEGITKNTRQLADDPPLSADSQNFMVQFEVRSNTQLFSNSTKNSDVGNVNDASHPTNTRCSVPSDGSPSIAPPNQDIPGLEDPALKDPGLEDMGLEISQQLVSLMGGTLHRGQTADGSRWFRVQLPLNLAELAVASGAKDLHPKPRILGLAPGQPAYRILVVDDHWENHQLLMQLLTTIGFEVQVAENGQQAIACWETWAPHLIWMDMRMPVMDGLEATRRIKHHPNGYQTVIIALTTSNVDNLRSVALSAGCDDFVHKPFQEHELLEKMAEHLGVRYLYDAIDAISEDKVTNATIAIDVADVERALIAMPTHWIQQLHQAATSADADIILQLLKQVPPVHYTLANTIAALTDDFRFSTIMELTHQVLTQQP